MTVGTEGAERKNPALAFAEDTAGFTGTMMRTGVTLEDDPCVVMGDRVDICEDDDEVLCLVPLPPDTDAETLRDDDADEVPGIVITEEEFADDVGIVDNEEVDEDDGIVRIDELEDDSGGPCMVEEAAAVELDETAVVVVVISMDRFPISAGAAVSTVTHESRETPADTR